jgi:lipoprotein-anchoring transpeptidase ErfK/SrfK
MTFRTTFSLALLTVIGLGSYSVPTHAATTTQSRNAAYQVGTSTPVPIFGGKFKNGASIAVADVTGDGVDEYIVGAGEGGGPQIEIYNQDGSVTRRFFAFSKTLTTGIMVAAGDLDGDGIGEIVAGTMAGAAPSLKVFSASGALLKTITPFESSYTGGMRVAILPARGADLGKVIVGSGIAREPEVRVFTWPTMIQESTWSPFGKTFGNGVPVAAAWSDVYSQPVLVIGNGAGYKPKIQVYGLTSKTVLGSWFAFDGKNLSGINVAVRHDVVAAVLGPTTPAVVQTFGIAGDWVVASPVFESTFRGGLLVGLQQVGGTVTPVVTPTTAPQSAAAAGKSIVVNLKKQRLYMYQYGHLVGVHVVSTGKWGMPTPTGTFKTKNKIANAYSKAYGLYMEWWMAITPDGKIGLHSLPYWKLKNGGKLYEGASHLGTPVSHGCIRQSYAEAKALYDWAPIGTPVTVVAK